MNEIQNKEFEILMEIQKILNKHNLRYFAIGGTCIGAIRHQGFIPWDDDIDIAMPRKDYELFRTIYYKELPEKYAKLDTDNSESNTLLFTKIYDSSTTYIEYYMKNSPDRFTGVYVDVMPVDGLPKDKKKRKQIFRRVRWLSCLNAINRKQPYANKNLKGYFKYFLGKVFEIKYQRNNFSAALMKLMEQFDYDESEYVLFTWRYGLSEDRMVFSKDYFNQLIEVPFENGFVQIPSGYDNYLKQDFGDYMKLPLVEDRRSVHDIYICDMDTPYSFYVEQEKKKK